MHVEEDVRITLLEAVPLNQPMRIDERVVLEPEAPILWFTFPGQWHDIGRFHLHNGQFTGLYANVIQPVTFLDRLTWHITDLYLDVWLGYGDRFEILDASELEAAVQQRVVEGSLADAAWDEVKRLQSAWRLGSWPPPVVREWTLDRVRNESFRGLGTVE